MLYLLGALACQRRWPDPAPSVFGFHEVFHAFTVAAYVLQYIAVSFVIYRAGTV